MTSWRRCLCACSRSGRDDADSGGRRRPDTAADGPDTENRLGDRLPPGFVPDFRGGPGGGNPVLGYRMMLYCRTGHHVGIFPGGVVRGTNLEFDKYAVMELSSVAVSEVRIRGVETNLYLAMNRKGRLYGEEDDTEEGTVFVEGLLGDYNIYLSRKYAHMGWYVAIKKSGKVKAGRKTVWPWRQKAIQFLPRRVPAGGNPPS